MKMKINKKKLTLNKTTIVTLDSEQALLAVKGGARPSNAEKSCDRISCKSYGEVNCSEGCG